MRQKPSKLEKYLLSDAQNSILCKVANFNPLGGGMVVLEEVTVYFLLRMQDVRKRSQMSQGLKSRRLKLLSDIRLGFVFSCGGHTVSL
jgi:hypothetical protein